MILMTSDNWTEYELLDSGHGGRFERFGDYNIVRPDPQAIWNPHLNISDWEKADAIFEEGGRERGLWQKQTKIPDRWLMHYKDLSFWARLTPFKHTGVFPEQAVQWDWMRAQLTATEKPAKVLSLFGYTGIATLACAAAGAQVTHLDASKPAVTWARDNQLASNLAGRPIRWIIDDALKFTRREIKRGVKYDGIIMDPPVYGHGPEGEIWDFHKSMPELLANCRAIMSNTPLFIIINAYAISSSAVLLQNLLEDNFGALGGHITIGELVIKESSRNRLLSTGIFGRWSRAQ